MANAIRSDLGPVSAYALAVKQGYQGTEEQWAQDQANAGQNASIASKAASDALRSERNAEQFALNADRFASTAMTQASTATSEAERAKGFSETASAGAVSAKEEAGKATQSATNASGFATKAETAQKAAEVAQGKAETAQGNAEEAARTAVENAKGLIDDKVFSKDKVFSSAMIAQTFSGAFVDHVQGEFIGSNIVSPIEHHVKCKVSGVPDLSSVVVKQTNQNLIPFPYDFSSGVNTAGVIYTYGDDGIVHTKGSASRYSPKVVCKNIKFKGTVYMSGCPNGGAFEKYGIQAAIDGSYPSEGLDYGNGTSFVVKEKIDSITIFTKPGHSDGLSFKPMITLFPDADFSVNIEKEFKPGPDGIVSGMTSISPYMVISVNTPGANVEVEYNLDGKKYVDKKFTELQSAILSQGANI